MGEEGPDRGPSVGSEAQSRAKYLAGVKWLIHIYYRAVATRGSVAIHFHRH
jgi:hypothetical protein